MESSWDWLTKRIFNIAFTLIRVVVWTLIISGFIGSVFFLFIVTTGCSGSQRSTALETSHKILIETSMIFADIDRVVATSAEQNGEAAIDRAAARYSNNECRQDDESPDQCITRLVGEEMEPWYRLTHAIESIYEVLETWEIANMEWDKTGERPPDWVRRVCVPIRTATQTILDLCERARVDIMPTWTPLVNHASQLCRLGAAEITEGSGNGQ